MVFPCDLGENSVLFEVVQTAAHPRVCVIERRGLKFEDNSGCQTGGRIGAKTDVVIFYGTNNKMGRTHSFQSTKINEEVLKSAPAAAAA
jgi:hypothetical protein